MLLLSFYKNRITTFRYRMVVIRTKRLSAYINFDVVHRTVSSNSVYYIQSNRKIDCQRILRAVQIKHLYHLTADIIYINLLKVIFIKVQSWPD